MQVNGTQLSPPSAEQARETKKLKEACRDFEAVLLGYMLKSMRKTVSKSEMFGSSGEQELFQEMMDTEFCKAASRSGSTGIADMLFRQLSADIEMQQRPDNTETRGNDE